MEASGASARLLLLAVVAALAFAGPAADHPPGRPRVFACGTELCLNGTPVDARARPNMYG